VSLLVPTAAAAADHVVIVRTYNTYGVSEHAARIASRTVKRLLSDAGIDAKWRDCRIVGRPAEPDTDPCADQVRPNELIVRLVAGKAAAPREDGTVTLGDSFIDPVSKTGSLATVYPDRVGLVALALRADFGMMVGRAIAHEIAHLLLGSQQHSRFGLMRGTWRATAMVPSDADWVFTHEQRDAIRMAVGSRIAARD
jgi:hypothetical protein